MKEFIVALALFPLLMWFPTQTIADNVNHKKIIAFNAIVDKYAQSARIDGCFTQDNIDNLKQELSEALYIEVTDIQFTGDTTPIMRTNTFNKAQMIHFRISVPINRFLAYGSFWGVPKELNKVDYIRENEVPSEYLGK